MGQVVCTAAHPVDLDDGRSLAPGESAEVDLDQPANKLLLENGQIVAQDEQKQKVRHQNQKSEEDKN